MSALSVQSSAVRSAAPTVFSFDRVFAALLIGQRYLIAMPPNETADSRGTLVDAAIAGYRCVAVKDDLSVPCGAGNGLALRQHLREIYDELLAALAVTRSVVAAARQAASRQVGSDGDLRARTHLRFIDATLATGYAHLEAIDALANGWQDLCAGPIDCPDPFQLVSDWPARDH